MNYENNLRAGWSNLLRKTRHNWDTVQNPDTYVQQNEGKRHLPSRGVRMITTLTQNDKLENIAYSLANVSQGHQKPDIDRYLIEQIEGGCQNAMKILYHKYYISLTVLINMCLTQDQDKAKVLHNSFLDIWSGQKIWDRRQSVKVFILSIVKKKINALNELVKKTVTPYRAVKLSNDESDIKIKMSDLQHQMSYLSPAHRGLLFLLHKESLSYEQIAVIENCSVESVKKRFLDVSKRFKPHIN